MRRSECRGSSDGTIYWDGGEVATGTSQREGRLGKKYFSGVGDQGEPMTPGLYPKENTLHQQHGESLKTKIKIPTFNCYVKITTNCTNCEISQIRNIMHFEF
jgi:hypothetical protein